MVLPQSLIDKWSHRLRLERLVGGLRSIVSAPRCVYACAMCLALSPMPLLALADDMIRTGLAVLAVEHAEHH